AGDAELGGLLLRSTAPGAWRCYPEGAATPSLLASLVHYASRSRLITVLGTGAPLANSGLGSHGNAALALNLLAASPRIVWLARGGPAIGRAGARPAARTGRGQHGAPAAGQPDPGRGVRGGDPARRRGGAARAVADAPARPAGDRAAAGGGPRLRDCGGPWQA